MESTLLQLGAIGAVLLWFMLRAEAKLESIALAQDRNTRAILLLTMALPSADEPMRRAAREILDEIDAPGRVRSA